MTYSITLPRATVQQVLVALQVSVTPLQKDRQEVLRAQAALHTALEQQQAEPKYKVSVIDDHYLAGVPLAQWGKQQAKPVALPKTPADISNMIGSSYVWREHKISDVDPHEDDKYCVTAHDLLEAFGNWSDKATPPQRTWQGLTEGEIHQLDPLPHDTFNQQRLDFARAIETKLREKNNA